MKKRLLCGNKLWNGKKQESDIVCFKMSEIYLERDAKKWTNIFLISAISC